MTRSHLTLACLVALIGCSETSGRSSHAEAGPGVDLAPGAEAGLNDLAGVVSDGVAGHDHGASVNEDAAAMQDSGGGITTYGKTYSGGQYHLGPVDWVESQWHNACAPGTKYAAAVRAAEGDLLAGLWNGIPNVSGYCDACIHVVTDKGKQALLRVVTYGDTSTNSIDVSPQAYAILNSGEYPRTMSWQFAKCSDSGAIMYEFKTGSSEWWTSFWVRNARVPLTSVEVKSQNHGYQTLVRESDGALTDGGGFGKGSFSIRLTGMDGTTVEDSFNWPSGGIAGQLLTGKGNFL